MPFVNTTSTILAVPSSRFNSDLSGNGRYVVGETTAGLVSGDTNGDYDIYWRDTLTGETRLVSATPSGAAGNSASRYSASVSDDGRYVAFQSSASDLVSGDTNGTGDVFLRDMQTGVTTRVSAGGNGISYNARITGDGHYVLFTTDATNLVSGDTNGSGDVIRYDVSTGQMLRISVSSTGAQTTDSTQHPEVSANGRYVVFDGYDGGLVPNDTNGAPDVFLRDTQTGTTTLVSVGLNGQRANSTSNYGHVSDDGRYVAFESFATNLAANDKNGNGDVYVRDMQTGMTTLVSVGLDGMAANSGGEIADISADGRYVLFSSYASNLVVGDTNGFSDIFLRDMVAGTTTRISLAQDGGQTNGDSTTARFSADGQSVIFGSVANNIVPGDSGAEYDVFRFALYATESADRLIGGDGADAIGGLGGADTIVGGLGADTMTGGSGNDTYYVDAAGDKVVEALSQGTDTVHATVASYTLTDNVERLYFDDTGAHTAKGNALSNLIYGNAGIDKFLIDSGGNDTFSGGGGEDTFDGRAAPTGMVLRLDAQANNAGSVAGDTFAAIEKFFGSDTAADQMTTGAARAKFFGYGGNDTLTGGSSIDALSGGAGNDSLVGNGGQDALDGGVGNDTMTGGAGADTFTFVDAAFGKDVITDFEDGVDRLKVFSAVADSFTDFTVSGNGTHHVVLTLAGATANTITLDNASANITVSAADFLFY